MTSKFTPRPWEVLAGFGSPMVVPLDHIGRRVGGSALDDVDRDQFVQIIARVPQDRHERGDAFANARLIAAAPEMLESLRIMSQLCALKYGNLDADVWAEILKARAAIAKAEGKP
jgi:hypothetical protein